MTPAQAGFYNAALEKLELQPVAEAGFRLDGAGWSPEVAKALADDDYLIVGGVFYGVIVTVAQRGIPIVRPAHTFDAVAVDEFFGRAPNQVAKITERTSLIVKVAANVDATRQARDLANIQHVTVSADDPIGLLSAAAFQRECDQKIRDETKEHWADADFRESFRASCARFGKLAHLQLDVPPQSISNIRSFGTRILGGSATAWVFQDLPKGEYLVVVADAEPHEQSTDHYRVVASLDEAEEVVDRLWRARLLDVPHERYRESWRQWPNRLDYLRRCLLAHAAKDEPASTKLHGLSEISRKRLEKRLGDKIPEAYWDLERYAAILAKNEEGVRALDAFVREKGLGTILAVPEEKNSPGTAAALQNFLARADQRILLRFRRFAPVAYHEAASLWPEHYHAWAKAEISAKNEIEAA